MHKKHSRLRVLHFQNTLNGENRYEKCRFVVFLDLDGVLNSRTTVQRTPEGYQGIDDACVELLSNVIHRMGGGDIVLTSD